MDEIVIDDSQKDNQKSFVTWRQTLDLLATLRAERDEAVKHLQSVIDWVANWDPNFREDDEWKPEEEEIRAFLAKLNQ